MVETMNYIGRCARSSEGKMREPREDHHQCNRDMTPNYLHLLRSLTIFTPGIVRLPDMDGLVASGRV